MFPADGNPALRYRLRGSTSWRGARTPLKISVMRRLLPALLTLFLTAETPPPATLAPYLSQGRFEPGDYGWMRGAFADATPAQKAEWRALWAWRNTCRAEQFASIRAELAKPGITPTAAIEQSNGNGVCGALAYAKPHGNQGDSWPAFQAAVGRGRPVALAIVWSAALAQAGADPDRPDSASLLIARPVTDQLLRRSVSWDQGEIAGAPPLDPAARSVGEGLIWLAISARDHANTAWLKALVAAQGWPTIAAVGEDASHMAWLLVQHADDDPVFQLDMLRLMEPLAARGEVAKHDYAYLYDRVMLKLAGKQRYGSQMTCAGGRNVPLPLEDAAHVDDLRRAMGLGTVAENTARIEKAYGPCPPDGIPPSP